MQGLQNLFGFPYNQQQNGQPHQQNMQQQPMQMPHQQQQQQPQQQPQAQQQQQQQAKAAPAAIPPVMNPNATAKDLYAAEGAIMKEYDPATKAWVQTTIKVQIERRPFSEGAMRSAYRMRIIEGIDVHGKDRVFVLKLSKDPKEPARQYYKDVEMQMEAKKWAGQFNKTGTPKQVDFISAQVVILIDRPAKPTCTMEKYVEGTYVKYNDNWAWCDERRNTPQAFSHWSWEASRNTLLVCDLQGVGDCWTDPQIHTVDGRGFGKGNAGLQGIRQFLTKHTCNGICRALKLPSVSGKQKVNDFGTQWGAALRQKRPLPPQPQQQQQKAAEPKVVEPAEKKPRVDASAPQQNQQRDHREREREQMRDLQTQKQQQAGYPPQPPQPREPREQPQAKPEAPAPAAAPVGPVGIGITIDGGASDGILLPLIVVSVKSGSPAAISGQVQRGDFIVQVGDVPVQGATVAQCKKLIQGTVGTELTLHLQRGIKLHMATLIRTAHTGPPTNKRKSKLYHEHAQMLLNGKGQDLDKITAEFAKPEASNKRQVPPPPARTAPKVLAHNVMADKENARENVPADLYGMDATVNKQHAGGPRPRAPPAQQSAGAPRPLATGQGQFLI